MLLGQSCGQEAAGKVLGQALGHQISVFVDAAQLRRAGLLDSARALGARSSVWVTLSVIVSRMLQAEAGS